MTAIEKTYTLFSPADGGGEKREGEVRAVVSRTSSGEVEQGDAVSEREFSLACVLRENAPEGGFRRGMRLCRGRVSYTVESATLCSRLWMLRLSRTFMYGEA